MFLGLLFVFSLVYCLPASVSHMLLETLDVSPIAKVEAADRIPSVTTDYMIM
jgi:hypothetical protein